MTGTTKRRRARSEERYPRLAGERRPVQGWSTIELSAVAGLTLISVALGLFRLGRKEMLPDEFDTWYVVTDTFSHMVSVIAAWDLNSAPYFVGLWFWSLVSDSPTWLRLPSVVGGAATVVLTAHLGRRLFGARVGLVAALLVAVSGSFLAFTQGMRSYTIVSALAAASSIIFLRAERRRTARAWTAYAAVGTALVTIHLFGALVVLAHAAWLLATQPARIRHPERGLVAAGVAISLVAGLMGLAVVAQLSDYESGYVGEPWELDTYRRVAVFWAGGSQKALLVLFVPLAAALVWAIRALRDRAIRSTAGEWFVIVGVALPTIVLAVVSVVGPNLVLTRYLIMCLPCFALLAARGFDILPRLLAAPLLAVVLLGSLLQVRTWLEAEPVEPFAALTAQILDGLQPGDQITFLHSYDRLGVLYNMRDVEVEDLPPLVSTEPLDPPGWRGEIVVGDPVAATAGGGMWVIALSPYGVLHDDHAERLEEWTDAGFELVSETEFPWRTLYEFRPSR